MLLLPLKPLLLPLKLLLLPLKLLLLPLKPLLLPLKPLLLPLKPLLLPLKLPLLLLKPLRLLLKPPPLKPQSNTYFRCQKAGVGRLFFVLFLRRERQTDFKQARATQNRCPGWQHQSSQASSSVPRPALHGPVRVDCSAHSDVQQARVAVAAS